MGLEKALQNVRTAVIAGSIGLAGFLNGPEIDRYQQPLVRSAIAHAHKISYEGLAKSSQTKKENCQEVIDKLSPYESKPDNKSAYFFNELGVAYRYCGKISKAEAAYKKAIELGPDRPNPKLNLAYLYFKHSNKPNAKNLARDLYEQVLKIDPKNPIATFYMDKLNKGS